MMRSCVTPIIHIVARSEMLRRTLASHLDSTRWRTSTYERLTEYLDGCPGNRLGCVVVEVPLNAMGDLELQQLWQGESTPPVIVVSAPGDVETAVRVMKDGAFDCLELPFDDLEFRDCVAAALNREAANQLARQRHAEVRDRIKSLTPREREVMTLLTLGSINKVIASNLGVSRRTVEFHRNSLMKKMGAPSLAHLINMCLELDGAARRRESGANRRSYSFDTDAAI